jgi:hypothetical protein
MKMIKYYIVLVIVLTSCNGFEELNINPNEPTTVSSGVLFTSAIRTSVQTTSNEAFLLSNNIAQLTAKTLRAEVDFYGWNAFPTVWEGLYESLTDLSSLISIAGEEKNDKMVGAAMVFESWIFSELTNAYGDIPYSDAIKGGESVFTPEYDTQASIYQDLLGKLDTAISKLKGSGTISGDILYNGDASKWIKFANGLKLRLLMYASNKIDVSASFKSVVDQGQLFESNADQAVLNFLNSFPNQFPTIPLKQGDFDAVAIGKSASDLMEFYRDPRLSRYARPDNLNFEAPEFTGVANGVGGQTGSRLGLSYFDYPGHITASEIGINYANGIIMSYAEVEFLIAEAIAKGWLSGDIESHYKKGIQASHDYYQVNYTPFGWTDFENFYQNSGVNYTSTLDIWEQKWLSLYFSALDPYYEVRRWYVEAGGWDALPFLNPPIGNNSNNYELPMRFLYPGQEQSLNAQNYNEANSRYSASKLINGKMWIVDF